MSVTSSPSSKDLMRNLLAQKDLLKIIIIALAETITGYTQTSVTAGTPYFEENSGKDDIAVGGLIRFDGAAFSLELFLGFSEALFLSLYENMFQMPAEEISAENHDLAGELLNIAFGAIDPKFRELGFRLTSSLPIVYSGQDLANALLKMDAQAIAIPYSANGKSFVVKLYSAGSLALKWQYPGKISSNL